MSGTRKLIGIRRLKNETSRIVDEVRERNAPYVITKRGEPVAVLRPWDERDDREQRLRQAAKTLAPLDRIASRVARAAGRKSAAAAVAAQRR